MCLGWTLVVRYRHNGLASASRSPTMGTEAMRESVQRTAPVGQTLLLLRTPIVGLCAVAWGVFIYIQLVAMWGKRTRHMRMSPRMVDAC